MYADLIFHACALQIDRYNRGSSFWNSRPQDVVGHSTVLPVLILEFHCTVQIEGYWYVL